MLQIFGRSLIFLLAVASIAGCSNSDSLLGDIDSSKGDKSAVTAAKSLSYDGYSSVLKQYVDETGLVDYEQLQANRQSLDEFNQTIASVEPETFLSWDESEQIAFLMNAYNSYTLAAIIDREPLPKSIRDIPKVWEKKQHQVVGQQKSLNDIEHGTLRKEYDEPRLHSAVVCAATSCPPLFNQPFVGNDLDTQLESRVTAWLSNPESGLKIDRQNNTVAVSQIFKWYGEDWISQYGTDEGFAGNNKEKAVLNFISNYVDAEDAEYLKTGNYQVKYLEYDWSLNKQ